MKQVEILSGTTRVLHIIVAVAMIILIAVGIYMTETENYGLYGLHKSVGAIVFVLALVRVAWRLKEGWPTALAATSKIQLAIAKLIHWILIAATVLFPASGLMLSIGGGHGLSVFGATIFTQNLDPVTGEVAALNDAIAGIGHTVHEVLPPLVIFAIVLHVAGALKHHVIDKDATMTRMFSHK